MGGYGSGRPGWKDKTDDFKALDIGALHRAGFLQFGRSGTWTWSRGGKKIGWIELRAEASAVMLTYRWRWRGSDWQDCKERVPVEWVACTLGGARPYFRCPGVVNGRQCGQRVGKLFAGGQYFLCRHCYGLAYASQTEPLHDRLIRKADRMRRALGGNAGTEEPIIRPKGMWQRTFRRQEAAILRTEARAERAMQGHVAGMIERLQARRNRR